MTTQTQTPVMVADEDEEVVIAGNDRTLRAETPEAVQAAIREIDRRAATKRDYIVPAKDIRFAYDEQLVAGDADAGEPILKSVPTLAAVIDHGEPAGKTAYGVGRYAHRQIAKALGIHGRYYSRLASGARDLLATNVNYWLERADRNFLVRTLDDEVRAVLSDRFRAIDDSDIFYATWPVIRDVGAQVTRIDVTETHFYLRALHPEWRMAIEHQREAGRNLIGGDHYGDPNALRQIGTDPDWIIPGIVIQNSEIGHGAVRIEQFLYRLKCRNGMVGDEAITRAHVGARQQFAGLLSDETMRAESAALFGTIKDVTRATFDRERFAAQVRRMSEATGEMLAAPTEAVAAVVKHYGMTDAERQRVLDEMMAGGDTSVFGLLQAITATAREAENYDRGIELERAGGDFLVRGPELVRVR